MDNPAGRLQHFFDLAFEQPQEGTAQEGWCEVFGLVHPDDTWLLPEQFGHMVRLAREARDLVEDLTDDDPDLQLEHFSEVERTLTHTIHMSNNKMHWFLNPLQETGRHSLRLCSSLLHRRMPEPTLSSDSRTQLSERVLHLMDEVRQADDLDADTRGAILDKLAEVYSALCQVDLTGTRPLTSAAESFDRVAGDTAGSVGTSQQKQRRNTPLRASGANRSRAEHNGQLPRVRAVRAAVARDRADLDGHQRRAAAAVGVAAWARWKPALDVRTGLAGAAGGPGRGGHPHDVAGVQGAPKRVYQWSYGGALSRAATSAEVAARVEAGPYVC
jgi:hypothetical protein